MDYREFSSDLPLPHTVFTSAEENEETMQSYGVDQRVRQLGSGRFRADMALLSTEKADLFADRFNKACSMYLGAPEGMVGLIFFKSANGGQFLASGESVANDTLVVLPEGSGTEMTTPDLAGSEAIALAKTRFIEMTEALCPTSRRPERMTVIKGNTAQLQALRKALIDLVSHPESNPDHEQLSNLLAATITWMGHSSSKWRSEDSHVNGTRRRIAKRAQEFIEEHFRETVRVEDLCRVTEVGVRTPQRSFREYFDLTITEYLKMVRLDAARRELAAAHPSRGSVTSIAQRHGFTHLGRFSVEFRKRFWESPTETLARRTGQKS